MHKKLLGIFSMVFLLHWVLQFFSWSFADAVPGVKMPFFRFAYIVLSFPVSQIIRSEWVDANIKMLVNSFIWALVFSMLVVVISKRGLTKNVK